jgi:hypothetical protein
VAGDLRSLASSNETQDVVVEYHGP